MSTDGLSPLSRTFYEQTKYKFVLSVFLFSLGILSLAFNCYYSGTAAIPMSLTVVIKLCSYKNMSVTALLNIERQVRPMLHTTSLKLMITIPTMTSMIKDNTH